MKKRIIVILTCLFIIISAVYFAPDSDAGVQTLNITSQSKTITIGQSFQCKLNGLKASKVKWSSSNKSIATVSKTGVVKGIKKGKATITGKYKSLKFKITVNVFKKGAEVYNSGDLSFKFKEAKVVDKYDDNCWKITFTFTNKSDAPTDFIGNYEPETYINNIEKDWEYNDDAYTNIKNGASVDVSFYYIVKSGDKIDFSLNGYDNNYNSFVIYETEATIK